MERRKIKEIEKSLIEFLLSTAKLVSSDFKISEFVEEYEGYVMGSIGLGNHEIAAYAYDIIKANYTDSDGKNVVITLTKDVNGELLDLDFWKEDFSKLLEYPKPKDLVFEN